MNYIGSKQSLLHFLDTCITKIIDKKVLIFCDLFAGTGVVGSHFKKKGFSIIANDIQYYSYVLNRHFIGNNKKLLFNQLVTIIPLLKNEAIENRKKIVCHFLSHIKGIKGFIYENYCFEGTPKNSKKLYFSNENAMKCDAIRQTIEHWKNEAFINLDEYYFLLASLINSIDQVANTASVYGAFLKKLKKSASHSLALKPSTLIINSKKHQVFNSDTNQLIRKIKGDILYLDPPYNQRQYGANYHLLETITKYDSPKIHGKTGLRDYSKEKSLYCQVKKVKEVFKDLILNADFKYIFLSYNNEGLMALDDIKKIMSLRGDYGCFKQLHSRFKADDTKKRNYKSTKTIEYLHYTICKKK